MAMSPRENALATYHHEKHDYVPMYGADTVLTGMFSLDVTDQPIRDGAKDIFGVPFVVDKLGPIPKSGFALFDDMRDWEKYVRIPDLDQIDFKAKAEQEFGIFGFDPRKPDRLNLTWGVVGSYMRLNFLMGFQNSLLALYAEPEACRDFFEALLPYEISWANKAIDAYNSDVFYIIEEVCSANSTFMSPECYRTLIEPYQREVVDAIRKRGVLVGVVCPGKVEEIVPDWIDEGISAWNCAQPINDLAGILDNYPLALEGGWSTQGACSALDATEEQVAEETLRCMTEYKKDGYVFWPQLINERGGSWVVGDDRLGAATKVWNENKYF